MSRGTVFLIALLSCAVTLAGAAHAAAPIDGRSAARWRPQPGWAPGREAVASGVEEADGRLEFWLEGDNSLMTWSLQPTPDELEDEPRYLVFTYRALNFAEEGRSYLLLGQDGSP
ncbi:MAG TPA: hypothetical protein VM283_03510, partial [Armatimonadota bacterium]|nr:hypothetical protein [Armatimonadota bacterium]